MWFNLSAFNYEGPKAYKKICTAEIIEDVYSFCFEQSLQEECREISSLVYTIRYGDCKDTEKSCDIWAKFNELLCKKVCEKAKTGKSYVETRKLGLGICLATMYKLDQS